MTLGGWKMDNYNHNNLIQPTNTQIGFSIAALVLGILSVMLFFTIIPPIILAILAIIFGVLGMKKSGKGLAIGGISAAGAGLLLTIIFMIFVIYWAATKPPLHVKNDAKEVSAEVTNTYVASDGAVSITYDTSKWEFRDELGESKVKGLALKNSLTGDIIGVIQCKEFSEKVSEEKYIKLLQEAYEKDAVAGSTSVTKLETDTKEFAVLHAQKKNDKDIIHIDTLVVYNGINQYEFIFQAADKYYEECNDSAYAVFESVRVLKEPTATVNDDPELAKGMETLDKLAGIDKKSVLDNVGKDGKEIVGSWGYKKAGGSFDIRLVFNEDGTYKRYKQYPDESSVLTGTWSYDGNRLLKLNTTKAIEDGKDIMSTIKPDQEYEIYYFKDNTMKVRHYPSLNEYTYIRAN